MSKARLSQLFRFLLPAALVATGLAAAAPAGAQNGPIVVGPPPGSGLGGSGLPYIPPPGAQDRGVPPDFQTYPLLNRIFGTGGAIFPGYVSPSNGRNDNDRLAYLTGGGQGRVIFAAGTADSLCQMAQAPQIKVLSAPPKVKISFDIGSFTATGTDAGSRRCVGRQAGGTRVFASGPAPLGSTVTLRVDYPLNGPSYTHVVTLPSK
ncbi:hypothetical protein FO470_15000 [Starkeya sp. 3C]|uniref:Uncharacterized protein n=1 Tax=Ancylobacter moscoviensis TaxID=2597768 RepID=A0ABY3DNN4_9HYPH|nr:hypothetical protein [Ancylobacter moscoviensis]TSJ60871.1 hypothetical protein FO470_15000 [Ancylobacter moscoviensis]